MVCLDCGARMVYDWKQMRIARQPAADQPSIRAQRENRRRRPVLPAADRWFWRLAHHR